MGGRRLTFLLLLLISTILSFPINGEAVTPKPRQALQIIIGGGGGNAAPPSPPPEYQPDCPPPPPPPCPPPPHPSPTPPKPPSKPPPKKTPPKPPSKPPPTDGFESERLRQAFKVIQVFKSKVNDPNGITKSWNGTKICQTYKGFKCDVVPDANQKTVSGLNFNHYNFSSSHHDLNDFLVGLKDIAFFHANSNRFYGTPTFDVGKLRFLFELDLSNNKFTGTFPYQVLSAEKLVFLDLRFNNLAGLVPPQVFLLDLDLLFINNNNFIQKLPDNLGSTPALYLTLANNKFIGGIPPSIGQASDTLLEVLFLNNQLTGCLPYQIGLLKKATVFDVGCNHLTGPIPHSFQCLQKMELLNLAQNKFYGAVPEAVCSLPKLSNFTLSYNYFTQVGPQCRKLISKGILDVKMNCILDLKNQRSPAECATFFSTPHTCPNEKSLSYVPCSKGYSHNQLESSDLERTTSLSPAPAPGPLGRGYGSLSPN